MTRDLTAAIEDWLSHRTDPARDPLRGMAQAGLLQPAENCMQIARGKALLVERTGLLGLGGIWAGCQMVNRWFIAGFGNAQQRATWLGRPAAVAISEPNAGAHPKRLTTRAEPDGDFYRITGEKAWVSNGPSADVFVVLAITATEGERKRYSAFLVPSDAANVSVREMPRFHALRPSQHCGLQLGGVTVPRSAMLGDENVAYETMALPFRDIEDAVSTYGLLGAFRFVLRALAGTPVSDETALALGGLVALSAVYADAAEALVAALDAGRLADKAATLVGLRVLAAEMTQRVRAYLPQAGRQHDPAIEEVLRDIDASLSVARGPRQARQARLATEA